MILNVRRKSWETQAIKWTGLNLEEVMQFIGSEFKYDAKTSYATNKFIYDHKINQLSLVVMGTKFPLKLGDYIVRTTLGDFGPVALEQFDNDFEVVFKINEETYYYPKYSVGETVIYQNGDRFELGVIKIVCEQKDHYFVNYNTGDVASRTHARNLHKITNAYAFNINRYSVDNPTSEDPETITLKTLLNFLAYGFKVKITSGPDKNIIYAGGYVENIRDNLESDIENKIVTLVYADYTEDTIIVEVR